MVSTQTNASSVIQLSSYRLFLVDMDDTLYDESDYVRSGFRAVADATRTWGYDPETAYAFLDDHFQREGRTLILDHLLLHLTGRAANRKHIAELVRVYRDHQPCLNLYPGAAETIAHLRQHGRVVIVTDGLDSMQERKFSALGLPDLVDDVVYCHRTGHPKPDPGSVQHIITPGDRHAVMIGDHPAHDLALADATRIDSIRVRTGRFRNVANAPWQPLADLAGFRELSGGVFD